MYIKISVNFFRLVFKKHKMLLFIPFFYLICFFLKRGLVSKETVVLFDKINYLII